MKLEFSRQFFEKYSNIKFHENPSSGSRVVPCGRTDGHEAKSRSSQFFPFQYSRITKGYSWRQQWYHALVTIPPRRLGHKILLEANQIAFTFPARIQVPELKGNEPNQRARLTDPRWGSNSIAPSEWGKTILHVDSGRWP